MFTHVVDDAINRVEFEGGEVAAVYDTDASNPLEDFGIKGMAVFRNERNYIGYDPEDLHRLYDDTEEYKAMTLWSIEKFTEALIREYGSKWWENMPEDEELIGDILESFDAVDEANDILKGMVSYTFNSKHYGAPEFRVIVDTDTFQKAWGPTCLEWKEEYQFVADTYADYAEGEVYLIGYTDNDGETHYCGNVMGIDVYDDEELKDFALEIF